MTQKDRQAAHLVATALELIAEQGGAELTMSAIAQRAGTSRQTVYNHFPDLAALIKAALDAHGAEMERMLRGIVEDAPDGGEKIAAIVGFMVEAAQADHAGIDLASLLPAEARADLARHEEMPRTLLAELFAATAGHDDPALIDLAWSIISAGAAVAGRHPDDAPRIKAAILAALGALHQTES